MRCPSICLPCVCPSVCSCDCHVRTCILSKRINVFSIFFTFRQPHILIFFRIKRHSNILTKTPTQRGRRMTWVGRSWDSDSIYGLIAWHTVNAATARCYQHDCRPIPGYRSMPAGASAINWRWSVLWCIRDCHGASLFKTQKATHQWIRRKEENVI